MKKKNEKTKKIAFPHYIKRRDGQGLEALGRVRLGALLYFNPLLQTASLSR
jgi:hypothetical protein